MPRCKKCRKVKNSDDFAWKNKRKNKKHGHCRKCQSAISNHWYQTHKERHLINVRRNTKETRRVNRQKLNDYLKQHPCVDCSETDPVVLDFDHVRGIKKFNISVAVNILSLSWNSIQKEIEKCDVRCANCHRRRHVRA